MTVDTRQRGRHERHVDVFEPTQPAFDLADGAELVTDLNRELADLVLGVVKHQRADCDKHSTVLQHGLDLGDQRIVDLECLDRAERRFCQ